MANEVKKSGKMTVFRTDRHEDMAAMVLVACAVGIVLVYMAFIVPTVAVSAPSDGKITAILATENAQIKKGDPIYSLEVKEKRFVQGQLEEKTVVKEIKSAAEGKVLKIEAKPGDDIKKGKPVLVVEHVKGTLP
ncbi:biotin/lipoyl-binding protein [Desulfolutivibrio sp.]|uniref:biotin/lipoyl-binding protein n=1 Tax=Desulfolutivibrio sp. TaxID=2773296 RepID=UPI002F963E0B